MTLALFRPLRLALACLIATGGAAFAQTKVRVGNVNTVSDIGIFIADKKGYFKAEGLDIEFIAFNTAARMIAPLGSGQLDVGGGTVSAGLYNAFTRKIGIRIVADKGSSRPGYNFSQIMVRKDLVESGRYKSFKDLKGMKVAVAAVGTGNAATLNQALKKVGLSFADVNTIDTCDVVQYLQRLGGRPGGDQGIGEAAGLLDARGIIVEMGVDALAARGGRGGGGRLCEGGGWQAHGPRHTGGGPEEGAARQGRAAAAGCGGRIMGGAGEETRHVDLPKDLVLI